MIYISVHLYCKREWKRFVSLWGIDHDWFNQYSEFIFNEDGTFPCLIYFFSPLLWTEKIFLLLLSSAQNLKWCNLLMNHLSLLWGNLAQPVIIIIIIIYQIPIFLSVFLFFYPQNVIILFILPDPETISKKKIMICLCLVFLSNWANVSRLFIRGWCLH